MCSKCPWLSITTCRPIVRITFTGQLALPPVSPCAGWALAHTLLTKPEVLASMHELLRASRECSHLWIGFLKALPCTAVVLKGGAELLNTWSSGKTWMCNGFSDEPWSCGENASNWSASCHVGCDIKSVTLLVVQHLDSWVSLVWVLADLELLLLSDKTDLT